MEYASIEFSAHAIQRMLERRIDADAIVRAIREGEIIAEYKDDMPCPSVLLLDIHDGLPLHVVTGIDLEEASFAS